MKIEKILKDKTLRNGIGIGLIVLGLANLLNIQQIINLLGPFQAVIWVGIAIGGYIIWRIK